MTQPTKVIDLTEPAREFAEAARYSRRALNAAREANRHSRRGWDLFRQKAAEFGIEVIDDDRTTDR